MTPNRLLTVECRKWEVRAALDMCNVVPDVSMEPNMCNVVPGVSMEPSVYNVVPGVPICTMLHLVSMEPNCVCQDVVNTCTSQPLVTLAPVVQNIWCALKRQHSRSH